MKRFYVSLIPIMALTVGVQSCKTRTSPASGTKSQNLEGVDSWLPDGVTFVCPKNRSDQLVTDMHKLLGDYHLKIGKQGQGPLPSIQVIETMTPQSNGFTSINYKLNTPPTDTDTLSISTRTQEFGDDVKPQMVPLVMSANFGTINKLLPSKKEILLGMMQNGRKFRFGIDYVRGGHHCAAAKLQEHIDIRYNTVQWGKRTHWHFPEDAHSSRNPALWDSDGSIKPNVRLQTAVADGWNPNGPKYSLGCYAALRLILLQGMLDYYDNGVRPFDPKLAASMDTMFNKVTLDPRSGKRWPLVGMEADVASSDTAETTQLTQLGTLLQRHFSVPWNNWIPGDWGYITNTDPEALPKNTDYNDDAPPLRAALRGDEGSNMIYGGMGGFLMYYDFYDVAEETLAEHIHSVWEWPQGNGNIKKWDPSLLPQLLANPYDPPKPGIPRGMVNARRDFVEILSPPLDPEIGNDNLATGKRVASSADVSALYKERCRMLTDQNSCAAARNNPEKCVWTQTNPQDGVFRGQPLCLSTASTRCGDYDGQKALCELAAGLSGAQCHFCPVKKAPQPDDDLSSSDDVGACMPFATPCTPAK